MQSLVISNHFPFVKIWEPSSNCKNHLYMVGHQVPGETFAFHTGKKPTLSPNFWWEKGQGPQGPPVSKNRFLLSELLSFFLKYVPGSINSHYFHIIWDGHQPYSRALYNYPLQGFPLKDGMTIPNVRSLDPGTYVFLVSWNSKANQF